MINKDMEKVLGTDIEILATIILAIETHNSIAFQYTKDVDYNEVRNVFPHNIYWNSEHTKVMLDGFQINGCSKSGKINSFKQFDCTFIKSCIVLDEKFHIQESYNSQSNRYKDSIIGVVD
ncbi:MAG: hypothetical protein V3V14_01205 [Saprospiraceae bacterium]